jgi:ABC-type transport system substrate-binding protein
MYEPLIGIDLNGKLQPSLAESWSVSRDGKVHTFRLRRVRFHNGQEMTAEDVKYAIDYTVNPKNGATGLKQLEVIQRVEVPDKHTIRLVLKSPSPSFLYALSSIQSFAVVPKGSLPEGVSQLNRYPAGTGPFKFTEWQPRQRIVFERYEDYWGHKAWADRVVLRPIADETVRFTALQAGDVDLVERTPYEWVKEVRDGKIKGVGYAEASTAGFRRLVFNVTAPPFDNKKLRQAIAHAVNKKELMEAAFYGFGAPADQKYPRGHSWYIEGVPTPQYDLERARTLVQDSGYRGQAVKFMTEQGVAYEAQAVALQAQLKRVGIDLKVETLDYGSYVQRWRSGEFEMKFAGGSVDPDPSRVYISELTCERDPKKRADNQSAYCDREVDALFRASEVEVDPEKRRELLRQVLTRLYEDVPSVPVGYVPRFFSLRDSVKGFVTDGEGSFRWTGGGLNHAWLDR